MKLTLTEDNQPLISFATSPKSKAVILITLWGGSGDILNHCMWFQPYTQYIVGRTRTSITICLDGGLLKIEEFWYLLFPTPPSEFLEHEWFDALLESDDNDTLEEIEAYTAQVLAFFKYTPPDFTKFGGESIRKLM